jgi:hypothetical protein
MKDTVTAAELTAEKFASAALVAVTMHVPALATFNEVPETVQPLAVPLVTL